MTTWLDTAAAAAHVGSNEHEVRRNAFDQSTGKTCPKGHLPGYKYRGRWRFDLAELDAYIRGAASGPRRITTGRRAS